MQIPPGTNTVVLISPSHLRVNEEHGIHIDWGGIIKMKGETEVPRSEELGREERKKNEGEKKEEWRFKFTSFKSQD